jgi:ubiquinone/menaquinone biosynthesis C-methylase UbiE
LNVPVAFGVAGDVYDRYMGRYSRLLAPLLADFAGVEPGMRALDVGCGPGALSHALVERLGAENVAAADPSESFVAACKERLPGIDVRQAAAERLPWPDDTFDAGLAQLVVNFMADPVAGVAEMNRVVRSGGVVAACTWDYREGMTMLRTFFDAALALDPYAPDEGQTMGVQDADDLRQVWSQAGLEHVETGELVVEAEYADFDDFWQPFTTGTGPAGAYCASLGTEQQNALREELRRRLGDPQSPFELSARAWAVRGLARPRVAEGP